MTFSNLTEGLQEIILFNSDSFIKLILMGGIFIFSIIYLFYWKPNKEKPSPFMTVGISRMIITSLSWVLLVFTPLSLGLLSPEYSLSDFYIVIMIPYLTLLLLFLAIFIVDFLYFAPQIMLKMGGFDISTPRVRKAYCIIKKFIKKQQ